MSTDVEIPQVRFTQRERRGVLLGRNWPQLILSAGSVVALVAIVLMVGWERVWGLIPVTAILVALGLWNFRGEPVLTLMAQSARYYGRVMRGQTKFRRRVWLRIATTPLPAGNPPEQIPVPVVFRHQTYPGGLADVAFVDIPGRGGFVYNARDHLAAVSVSVKALAWTLRDDGRKAQAANGLAGWMSSLEGLPGLFEAVLRVRVDRSPSTELAEYAAQRDEVRETTVSKGAIRTYDWLVAAEQSRSMEFSSTITLVFDTNALSGEIRDSGGGLAGLGAVLADQVAALEDVVGDLDVTFEEWHDAETLDAMTTTALDPVTASSRRERFGRSRAEMRSRPPIMSGDETVEDVTFGQSIHRTLWLHEWPRTKVRAGFLHPLLYSGEATRCVAIQFRPVPLHDALTELTSAQIDMETADNLREKFGRRSTVMQEREKDNLDEREEDLADGHTDIRFRGYVTISADNVAEVRRDQTSLEQAGYRAAVRMAVLRDQQWAALVTCALPIPTRPKGKK